MNPLVIIPARGGSKGIPNKNIKLLAGKPLIQYTIDVACELFDDERICVTTDSEKIIDVVTKMGLKVPFKRPEYLATDTATTHDVILDAIEYYQKNTSIAFDTIILLQPTSPFRNSTHIQAAMLEFNKDLDAVFSVKETKANPYYVLKEEDNKGFLVSSKQGSFTRRQDCPKVYELNGAIYIISLKALQLQKMSEFKRVKKYIMSEKDSVDIDEPLDWVVAESIILNGK